MKKFMTVLMALTMVIGFAGLASAEIYICEDDPGHIDRGCETAAEQGSCVTTPFDYDDFYGYNWGCSAANGSYCESPDKYDFHRALFKICDCISEGIFPSIDTGDILDIGMEIMVDKHDGNGPVSGDNGVYWAQDVNVSGVLMEAFSSQGVACADTSCYPSNAFVGDFDYMLADGTTTAASPYIGTSCDVPEDQEIVKFRACPTQSGTHGYTVTADDAVQNNSVYWIDIPAMRADSNITKDTGWDVYVKICLYTSLDTGGVCGDCEGCCYEMKIGTLCCEDTVTPTECEDVLTFPYFPKSDNFWLGMAITNTSDEDGEVAITLYENDGDTATGTFTVPANQTKIIATSDLTTAGTLGDAQAYVKAVAEFSAAGFAMFGNNTTGVSMGYLPERCSGCTTCKY